MAPTWVTALVSLCISGVWTASLLIGFLQQNYTPLTVTTPVMLVLAGYAFGVKIINRQDK
jgi:hypothetical protein